MSTGLYSITTRPTGFLLTAAAYNADQQNHVTNQNPSMTGAFSDDVGQMQNTTDPGGVGTEHLAASLAEELGELRFVLAKLGGVTNWYDYANYKVTFSGSTLVVDSLHLTTALAVAYGGTGLTAGHSGGVPYYSADGTLAASAALTANKPVIGGGAGSAPAVGTVSGDTTEFATSTGAKTSGHLATWDASGNLQDGGAVPGAGVFTGKFTDTQQTWPVAGATLTRAHGLGAAPFGVIIVLHCTTAEAGYSIGDEIIMQPGLQNVGGTYIGVTVWCDATNVNVVMNTSARIDALNKSTGAGVVLTNADWKMIIKAWV